MKNRVDIMVDIETLGTDSKATIFQISAIAFDIETGKYYSTFNVIADIAKNTSLNVDGRTLKWWLNTDKELLANLLNEGNMSSKELLMTFNEWLIDQSEELKNIYLWGNGILFDNALIQEQLLSIGLKYPVFYRNDRDVRTIVDLAGKKLGITEQELKGKFLDEKLVKHNAINDVKFQIDLVVGCYNLLTK